MSDEDKQVNGTSPENDPLATAMELGYVQAYYFDADSGKFYNDDDKVFKFEFYPHESKFITSDGYVLEFRKFNLQSIQNYSSSYERKYKPKMPRKAVEYDEGEYYLDGNPNDPWYQDALLEYQNRGNLEAAAFQVSLSVKNKMPERKDWDENLEDYIIGLEELEGELSKHRLRYEWICWIMPDNTELRVFTRILAGMQLPTREGIAQAEERFPGDSRSD